MRAMTVDERLVMEAMIRHAHAFDPDQRDPEPADRQRWLAMIDDLSVHGVCGCGTCPTIDLAYKGEPVECGEHTATAILQADTRDAVVLLLVDNDIPSCLEVAPLNDDPVALPSPEEIIFG